MTDILILFTDAYSLLTNIMLKISVSIKTVAISIKIRCLFTCVWFEEISHFLPGIK
jgi:hypothetical protein